MNERFYGNDDGELVLGLVVKFFPMSDEVSSSESSLLY